MLFFHGWLLGHRLVKIWVKYGNLHTSRERWWQDCFEFRYRLQRELNSKIWGFYSFFSTAKPSEILRIKESTHLQTRQSVGINLKVETPDGPRTIANNSFVSRPSSPQVGTHLKVIQGQGRFTVEAAARRVGNHPTPKGYREEKGNLLRVQKLSAFILQHWHDWSRSWN